MSQQTLPNDMELAALIASKVCHDVINPVGAINNGLEMLDEEDDPESREYALDMIRNVTSQATVRLKFARFAYGAAGSAGDSIDLRMAEEICREYVVKGGKHTLVWQGPAGYMAKDKVKLLLNLVSLGSVGAAARRRACGRHRPAAEPSRLPRALPRAGRAAADASRRIPDRPERAADRCADRADLLYLPARPDGRNSARGAEGWRRHHPERPLLGHASGSGRPFHFYNSSVTA